MKLICNVTGDEINHKSSIATKGPTMPKSNERFVNYFLNYQLCQQVSNIFNQVCRVPAFLIKTMSRQEQLLKWNAVNHKVAIKSIPSVSVPWRAQKKPINSNIFHPHPHSGSSLQILLVGVSVGILRLGAHLRFLAPTQVHPTIHNMRRRQLHIQKLS